MKRTQTSDSGRSKPVSLKKGCLIQSFLGCLGLVPCLSNGMCRSGYWESLIGSLPHGKLESSCLELRAGIIVATVVVPNKNGDPRCCLGISRTLLPKDWSLWPARIQEKVLLSRILQAHLSPASFKRAI